MQKKIIFYLVFLFALRSCVPLVAQYADFLDKDFGQNGIKRLDLSFFEEPVALNIRPDGKIMVLANTGASPSTLDLALLRLESDGSMDTSFGLAGLVQQDLGTFTKTIAKDMAVYLDGSIVVLAELEDSIGRCYMGLGKFLENGQIDSSFGQNGFVLENILSLGSIPYDLELFPDKRLMVTGVSYDSIAGDYPFMVRFLENGSLDTSLAHSGKMVFDFAIGTIPLRVAEPIKTALPHLNGGIFKQIKHQKNGGFLCIGGYNAGSTFDAVVVKFLENGQLDSSAFTNSWQIYSPEPLHAQFFDKEVESSDGTHHFIFNHQTTGVLTPTEMYVASILPDGRPLLSELPYSIPFEWGNDLQLEGDSVLWLAGRAFTEERFFPGAPSDSAFIWSLRWDAANASWIRNASFGNSGYLAWKFNQDSVDRSYIDEIALVENQKILVLGFVFMPTNPQNISDLILAQFHRNLADSTSSIDMLRSESSAYFNLRPNPSTTEDVQINFYSDEHSFVEIEVFSALGKLIYKQKCQCENQVTLPSSTWESGLYYIRAKKSGGEMVVRRLVRLRR